MFLIPLCPREHSSTPLPYPADAKLASDPIPFNNHIGNPVPQSTEVIGAEHIQHTYAAY